MFQLPVVASATAHIQGTTARSFAARPTATGTGYASTARVCATLVSKATRARSPSARIVALMGESAWRAARAAARSAIRATTAASRSRPLRPPSFVARRLRRLQRLFSRLRHPWRRSVPALRRHAAPPCALATAHAVLTERARASLDGPAAAANSRRVRMCAARLAAASASLAAAAVAAAATAAFTAAVAAAASARAGARGCLPSASSELALARPLLATAAATVTAT